jgi:hypothetical protein
VPVIPAQPAAASTGGPPANIPRLPKPGSTPVLPVVAGGNSRGLLRVVTNDELDMAQKRTQTLEKLPQAVISDLANYVRNRFEKAVRHRRTVGIDDELIRDMRAYNGQYDPGKLQEIRKFGGSEVYSRQMAMKCRGATALLRNVYMNSDRPWTLTPTPDPEIPDSIDTHIRQLVMLEVQNVNMTTGEIVDQDKVAARMEGLYDAAKASEKVKAAEEAEEAQTKIDDILTEGKFYDALSDFLIDLPIYKFAVIKGPITRKSTQLKWKKGKPIAEEKAKFFWSRVSPWDVWFSPGATDISNTEVFERQRMSIQDLYALIGLPGYREKDIREIISTYEARGFKEWIMIFDTERALMEGRNNVLDDTFINAVEFHGHVLGKYLKEFGVPGVDDEQKPYFITAWLVDKQIFKVMLNPSPRMRVPYFVSSFDKQPGTLYGNGIPGMANDLTDVMNATLRALVNNMAIASGPQVVMNVDMLGPTQDTALYPWKVWSYTGDPSSPNHKPMEFFQPQDNSQALISVMDKFSTLLDDVSTIPRYLTGSGASSGAGRTASGLSMLINNANKTLQNVADNIDKDIFSPLLELLYDFVMLTDSTGMLRGDESIQVDGVRQASKQDQDLTRQLEFLQLINNPNYVAHFEPGEVGRILQSIADNLGMIVRVKDGKAAPQGFVLQDGASPGGGPNPTGTNVAAPNPAMAAPGAGGVPGIQAAPQVGPAGGASMVGAG